MPENAVAWRESLIFHRLAKPAAPIARSRLTPGGGAVRLNIPQAGHGYPQGTQHPIIR